MCLQYLRLDGSTPVAARQSLVDAFNRAQLPSRREEESKGLSSGVGRAAAGSSSVSIMLLSTRAGGLG